MTWVRVYSSPTANRAHLLSEGTSPNSSAPALCGLSPDLGTYWMGTGTHEETEHVDHLGLCMRCYRRVKNIEEEAA